MSYGRRTIREHVEKNNIAEHSLWPFEKGPAEDGYAGADEDLQLSRPAGDGGKYSLYMDHTDGAIFLWPTDKRVPAKLNPNLIARGTEDELMGAIARFCSNEWGRYDKNTPGYPYKYQDAALGFNWPTGTLAGVAIAIRVVGAALDGRINDAWDIGKAYGHKVERALDPKYWAARDAAEAAMAAADEQDEADLEEFEADA